MTAATRQAQLSTTPMTTMRIRTKRVQLKRRGAACSAMACKAVRSSMNMPLAPISVVATANSVLEIALPAVMLARPRLSMPASVSASRSPSRLRKVSRIIARAA